MTASFQTPSTAPTVLPLREALSPLGRTRDNGDAVQVLIDRTGLPAPTLVPQPDAVHVMLADIDDMAPWLAELGGRLVVDGTPGCRTWTLLTELEATRRRGAVPVQVHALTVLGQDVLPSLRSAVAA
ncbi:hypothetical protein ACIRQH_34725 [Streptomyces sp. NPDC102279]|uniref:hypothetical protein n=1 Tax=Streptomyces sp. NPDC102279 TaxID=3366153 RepID=UPI0037F6D6D4